MAKSKVSKKEQNEMDEIPMADDDASCIGEIRISHSVIANIAVLSAMKTDGVLMVGKQGFANGIASFFSSKKPGENGVSISEDEFGNYVIDISVTVKFGCELAKVAADIQKTVVENIKRMTTNGVSKVNITIDGVEIPGECEKGNPECTQ